VIVPLVTPFQKEGEEVDEGAMTALCDWLVRQGVHGLMPCGTTGEAPLLTTEERVRLLEVTLKAVDGRVPVIAHVGAATTRETIYLAKHAEAVGIPAVSVVTPYYFPVSLETMVEHYVRVASAVPDLTVYLYNIPSRTVNNFTRAGAEAVIARCPNVWGVKDSSGCLENTTSFIGLKEGRFQVAVGSDSLVYPGLENGAVACVSGNSNAFPEITVALFEAFWRGDLETAARQQQKLDLVRNALANGGDLSMLKRAIRYRGIDAGHVRPPLLDFPEAQWPAVEAQLAGLAH
jgi:4-hydroxy-tetrahydrodipicolinate synthase